MTNPPGDGPTPPEEPREQPQPGSGQPSGGQQPGGQVPGQPPGGQAPGQPGWWEQQAQQQPPYPQYYPHAPIQYAPDHPKATTSLVLGILGVVLCQVVAPFAWVIGKRTLDEIDASQGRVGGRGAAQAGYILGIIGTVLLGLGLIFFLIYIVFAIALIGGGIATG